MPPSIVASTEACEIVVVDSATGETTRLWEYKYISAAKTPFYYCGPYPEDVEALEAILPPNYESGPSFIDDLEWIDTGYILISECCEPISGRFNLLAMPSTSQIKEPLRFRLSGGSPDINDDHSLLLKKYVHLQSRSYPISVIDSFDVNSDDAFHPEYPSYSSAGDQTNYGLLFDQDDISFGNRAEVGNVSWLNNHRIAFDVFIWHSGLSDLEVVSWIGVIDLTQQSVSLNSRSPGSGWSMPTGDELGNLIVTEQPCDYLFIKCEDRSRIVTVDSHTLLPIHELEIDGNIADLDLVRGWLLITLTDGRMGTIDFTTGEFSVIADGITHAVWME